MKNKKRRSIHKKKTISILKLLKVAVFMSSLSALLLLLRISYNYSRPINFESIPLVLGPGENFRFAPIDAKGLVVMHQNKTIYDNLRPQNNISVATKSRQVALNQSDNLIDILKNSYLAQSDAKENPFSVLNDQGCYILNFGSVTTHAIAENKMQKLVIKYSILTKIKLISFVAQSGYTIQTNGCLKKDEALRICKQIHSKGEECAAQEFNEN